MDILVDYTEIGIGMRKLLEPKSGRKCFVMSSIAKMTVVIVDRMSRLKFRCIGEMTFASLGQMSQQCNTGGNRTSHLCEGASVFLSK
jgi:hypothetical protein